MLRKPLLSALCLLLSLFSAHLTVVEAQENFSLPAPTGAYAVGSVWHHWVDETRQETFDEAPHGSREMMVEILYPASPEKSAVPEAYMPNRDTILSFFGEFVGAIVESPTTFDPAAFAQVQTHTFPGAPLSDDQPSYPVLIFSHGANAEVSMYTSLFEDLVSHGYIVVAIDHAYGAPIVFPDGRVAYPNFSEGLEGAAPVWAQDQIFVMDQLAALNAKDPDGLLTGHLNLERIGVFGHSVGGAAATITCFLDARCKAGVNMDGPVFGDVIKQGLKQPFMYLLSKARAFSDPAFFAQAKGAYYEADFKGFEHLDFSDLPLWPGMDATRKAGWLGTVQPVRTMVITNAYILAFFDQALKGEDQALLKGASSDYPEVALTTRNTAAP